MKHLLAYVFILFTAAATADDHRQAVNTVLDALHHNAATANYEGYFDLYSDEAVFIGTDASEVWSIEEFKAYAKPHFDKGKGWTYIPRNRHVYFAKQGNVAWFDELLDNQKLGETRGTGVLIKEGNRWKVSQYHLTIPIPNALADDIANQIQTFRAPQ
ncbi:nuclear transport factor 2 family protein [Alteromonas sp. D210916BOD_24]|uniref:nuclear transport factor 2 family protein n=1 Tax=Alteromonas sp. D210916BOD_24 TaxID=3157618 RepID=UPI00399D4978